MKKLLFAAFIAASIMSAQSVDAPKPSAPPTERTIAKQEATDLQVTILKMNLLNDEYKIAEYQSKAAPLRARQQELHDAMCISVGVPKEKVNAFYADGRPYCGLSGFDEKGDAPIGPDGKPMKQTVVFNPPPAVPTSGTK